MSDQLALTKGIIHGLLHADRVKSKKTSCTSTSTSSTITTSMDYVKQITSMAGNVCRFVSSPEELSVNSKNCVVAVLLSDWWKLQLVHATSMSSSSERKKKINLPGPVYIATYRHKLPGVLFYVSLLKQICAQGGALSVKISGQNQLPLFTSQQASHNWREDKLLNQLFLYWAEAWKVRTFARMNIFMQDGY